MIKVFIDGREGTTGLKIDERLRPRKDIEVIVLPEERRKDTKARQEAINSSDVTFLCLPDAAAKEAVTLVTNPKTEFAFCIEPVEEYDGVIMPDDNYARIHGGGTVKFDPITFTRDAAPGA